VTDDLLFEVADGIARLTFNRPQARNALTFAMYERLAEICTIVDGDPAVKVMLLTGAGDKAFAAGTDISQFRSFATQEDALAYEGRMDRVLGVLERCRVPSIAAIAGACTGGGAAIAAACDIRVAASTARFGFPVARTLGNCLSMGNYARLSALIGAARVKELIFTARLIDADEGRAIGLYSEIVDDAAGLSTRAEELARTIAGHAPLTLRATKEALRRLQDKIAPGDGDDLVVMCYMSGDFREGMEAFLAKRPAHWRGE
jgi:enoyl-CoA hydratase/carnithine racemase